MNILPRLFGTLRCILFLLLAKFHEIPAKFIQVGPCLVSWGVECPDPHVNFFLYTRQNPRTPQKVSPDVRNISSSNFNPFVANKFIIHGFNSDPNLDALIDMKQAYLTAGDANVWMLDWSTVASGPCYPIVVTSLNYVGKCASDMIREILNLTKLPRDRAIHVIGFSMGAPLAGYVANNLRPYKLPRITGLDPALPLFTTVIKDHKLDKSDAIFVDVIHTDGFLEGKIERSGHVDFYMNGGIQQPGCWKGKFFENSQCNHHRAPEYFAESITTEMGFWGWPCKNILYYLLKRCPYVYPNTLMGEYVDQTSKGYYIAQTNASAPYALGRTSHDETDSYLLQLEEQFRSLVTQSLNITSLDTAVRMTDEEFDNVIGNSLGSASEMAYITSIYLSYYMSKFNVSIRMKESKNIEFGHTF